jgi:eukaryotic-like serine/threonine-protein kinase
MSRVAISRSERWRQVEDLCERVLALEPRKRHAFLSDACGDDEPLRREVESLLTNASRAENFLAPSALAAEAHVIVNQRPATQTGRRIGTYEIRTRLGVGGMGEVYRARDLKLGRDVAIKVLPPHLTVDVERLARFEREARTLASLNHSHIGAIYGLEDADGTHALVLELIEGQTLAEALIGKAVPIDRALTLAVQIAEALDHAHRRGVIHRDLKPSNVMLTNSGAKLLDFGLAKWARSAAVEPSDLSPTLTADQKSLTNAGAILGTLNYMAPEQLEGREADARSDLFAFGAVLYEMLTGRKAFEGQSQATVIMEILTSQPPAPSTLQTLVPARLDRVVQKCLAKDPDARWQSARDLADELTWIAEEVVRPPGSTSGRATTSRTAGSQRLSIAVVPAVVVAAIIAILAAWTAWRFAVSRQLPVTRAVTRFVVQPPATAPLAGRNFNISPDGSQLVYTGLESGVRRLFLRHVDQFDAAALPGTEGAAYPFFSPDGQWVGFSRDDRLLKIDVRAAAPPVVLCNVFAAFPAWLTDGTILFQSTGHGIRRVSADGGEPRVITTISKNPGEYDHHDAQMLPGGQALLFTIHEGVERFSVAVQSLASGQRKVIVESGFGAHYSPSGHIVYAAGSSIRAVPFDLHRLEVTGPPITLIEHVATVPNDGNGNFRLSESGSLVFQPERSIAGRRLTWVDRSGAETPLPIPPRAFTTARVSPDGRRLAFAAADGDREDIWTYELATGALTRATLEDINRAPLWTRDGRRLTYEKLRAGTHYLFWQPADGSGPAEPLLSGLDRLHPGAWTPGGRALLYVDSPPSDRSDILTLLLDGERRSQLAIQKPPEAYEETYADLPSFSPDGRWLAYTSNETARDQVYVQAFPGPGTRHQVTEGGGSAPMWRRDGRELFFLDGGQMFAAPVSTTHLFSASKPVRLFENRYVANRLLAGFPYDVAPDGRFLMIKPGEEEQTPSRLNVVVNWVDELVRRVPSGKER